LLVNLCTIRMRPMKSIPTVAKRCSPGNGSRTAAGAGSCSVKSLYTEKRCTVRWKYCCPGRRMLDGKCPMFGLSGKASVSRQ